MVHMTSSAIPLLLLLLLSCGSSTAEKIQQKFRPEWAQNLNQKHVGNGLGTSQLNPQTRIVNGNEVSAISSAPYQVRVVVGSSLCGGSLVDAQYVLTAAHCCDSSSQSGTISTYYTITAGTTSINSGGTSRTVSEVYLHPNWDGSSLALESGYDVCLLKLSSAFTTSSDIAVIPMASSNPSDGTSSRITGWGTTSAYSYTESNPGSVSSTLREATVTVYTESSTDTQYTTYNNALSCNGPADVAVSYDFNGAFSASTTAEPVTDACQGDSGGPLAYSDSSSSVGYTVAGVVSHGYGCAQLNSPGFYASVANSRSWIDPIIAGTSNITLCNSINCGPNAECVNDACSCKSGFTDLSSSSHWLGHQCYRWLSSSPTLISGSFYYFELVDTATAWGSTTVRGWSAPSSISGTFPCGYAPNPSSTVASLINSYLSSNSLTAPSDRVWTDLSTGTTSSWYSWSSISYDNGVDSSINWASGEPSSSSSSCASMSVATSTLAEVYAESCSNTYYYVRAFTTAANGRSWDSPSPGVITSSSGSSPASSPTSSPTTTSAATAGGPAAWLVALAVAVVGLQAIM